MLLNPTQQKKKKKLVANCRRIGNFNQIQPPFTRCLFGSLLWRVPKKNLPRGASDSCDIRRSSNGCKIVSVNWRKFTIQEDEPQYEYYTAEPNTWRLPCEGAACVWNRISVCWNFWGVKKLPQPPIWCVEAGGCKLPVSAFPTRALTSVKTPICILTRQHHKKKKKAPAPPSPEAEIFTLTRASSTQRAVFGHITTKMANYPKTTGGVKMMRLSITDEPTSYPS